MTCGRGESGRLDTRPSERGDAFWAYLRLKYVLGQFAEQSVVRFLLLDPSRLGGYVDDSRGNDEMVVEIAMRFLIRIG